MAVPQGWEWKNLYRSGAFGAQRSPAEFSQGGPRSRPEQASFLVRSSVESQGKALSHPAGLHPRLLAHRPPLRRFHLPYGACVQCSPRLSRTGKIRGIAARGYDSKVAVVPVNFVALFSLENWVRMQLLYNS